MDPRRCTVPASVGSRPGWGGERALHVGRRGSTCSGSHRSRRLDGRAGEQLAQTIDLGVAARLDAWRGRLRGNGRCRRLGALHARGVGVVLIGPRPVVDRRADVATTGSATLERPTRRLRQAQPRPEATDTQREVARTRTPNDPGRETRARTVPLGQPATERGGRRLGHVDVRHRAPGSRDGRSPALRPPCRRWPRRSSGRATSPGTRRRSPTSASACRSGRRA